MKFDKFDQKKATHWKVLKIFEVFIEKWYILKEKSEKKIVKQGEGKFFCLPLSTCNVLSSVVDSSAVDT